MAMLSSGTLSPLVSQDKDRQSRSINSKSCGPSVRPPPHYPLSWFKQQKRVGSVRPDDSPMKAQVAFLGAVDQLRYEAQLKQKPRPGIGVQFQDKRAFKPCSSRASSYVEPTESHHLPSQQEMTQNSVKKTQPANILAKPLVLSAFSSLPQSVTPTTSKIPPRSEPKLIGPSHASGKPSLEDIAERDAVSWECKREKHAHTRDSLFPGSQMGTPTKNKLESNPRVIRNSQQPAPPAGPFEHKHGRQQSRESVDLGAGSQFGHQPAPLSAPKFSSPRELTTAHASIDPDYEQAHKDFLPTTFSSSADHQPRGIKRKLSVASAPATPIKKEEFYDTKKLVTCRASSADPRIGNVCKIKELDAGRDQTDWDSHESEFKRKKFPGLVQQSSLESLRSGKLDKLTIGHPGNQKPTRSQCSYSTEATSAAFTARAPFQKPKKMQMQKDLGVPSSLEAGHGRFQSLSPCAGMSTQPGTTTSSALSVHPHTHRAQLADRTSNRHVDTDLSGARSDLRSAKQFGDHFYKLPKMHLTASDQAKKVTLPSLSSPLPWPYHQSSFHQSQVSSARAHPGYDFPNPVSPPCRAPQASSSRAQVPTGPAPEKPNFSYAALIGQAIMQSSTKKVSLNEIYGYIAERYPFYRKDEPGWQNSIRHNLSLNESFVKVARGPERPGKGSLWTIAAGDESQFVNGGFKKKAMEVSRRGLAGGRKKPKKLAEGGEPVGKMDSSVDGFGTILRRQEGQKQKPDRSGVKEEHDKERQEEEKGEEEELYIEKAASFEEWEGQSQGTRWESEEQMWKPQERMIDANQDCGRIASLRGKSSPDGELPKLSFFLTSPPMKNGGVMMGKSKDETMADPTNQPIIDESDVTFGRPSRDYLNRDDGRKLKKTQQYTLPHLPMMMFREGSAKVGSRSSANQNTQDQRAYVIKSVDEDALGKRGWSDGEEDGGMESLKLAPLQNQNILKTPNRSASGQPESSKVKLMSISDLLTTPRSVSSSSSMKLTPLKPVHSALKALDSRQHSGHPELVSWPKLSKNQLVKSPIPQRPPSSMTVGNKQKENEILANGHLKKCGGNGWSEEQGVRDRQVPWFGTPAGRFINSSPGSDGEDIWEPKPDGAGAHQEDNESGGLGITEQLKRIDWKFSQHAQASQDWVTEEPLPVLEDERMMG